MSNENETAVPSRLVEQALKDVREKLRAGPEWRNVRCQRCYGDGLVARETVYYPVGDDGTMNAEDVDSKLCPDCQSWGVPLTTLVYHLDCGGDCQACLDPRDSSYDRVRMEQ